MSAVGTKKTEMAEARGLWEKTEVLLVGLAGVLCFVLVYGPHLVGAYVWDDVYLVQYHPALRAAEGWRVLWGADLWGGATGRASQLYHPLPMWSFWLEAQTWGLEVHKARMVNGLLHVGVGMLLWGLLFRWLSVRALAWLGALLFWMHPLMTETVMWLTGRHDSMAVLLGMFALWLWPIEGPFRVRTVMYALLASLCCAGALLCKEPYIVLPLLLALLPWCLAVPKRRLPWSAVLPILPILAVLAVMWLRRSLGITSGSAQLYAPVAEHLQHFFGIGLRYLFQLFSWQGAPTIAPYHPMSWRFWIGGAAVVLLGIAWVVRCVLAARRSAESAEDTASVRAWGLVLWGILAYGVCWIPHLLSLPMIGLWGNRYAYFPWVLLVMVAMGAAVLLREWVSLPMQRAAWVGGGLLLLWGGYATAQEAKHWRSNLTLYQADVLRDPTNGRAMYHFAHAIRIRFGCQRAAGLFLRAARLDPTYLRSWQNAAGCLLELGRYREALEPAREAVKRAPALARMRYNLALALSFSHQRKEALKEVTEALALSPDYAPAQRLFFALQASPTSHPSSRPASHPSSRLPR